MHVNYTKWGNEAQNGSPALLRLHSALGPAWTPWDDLGTDVHSVTESREGMDITGWRQRAKPAGKACAATLPSGHPRHRGETTENWEEGTETSLPSPSNPLRFQKGSGMLLCLPPLGPV